MTWQEQRTHDQAQTATGLLRQMINLSPDIKKYLVSSEFAAQREYITGKGVVSKLRKDSK
jgi:hypothetical protein